MTSKNKIENGELRMENYPGAAANSQFSILNSPLKRNLLGMSLAELQQLCAEEGMPKFAAKQICDWLYAKQVDSIDAMTNLSLKARSRLNEIAYIGRHAPVNCQVSKDGTKKYLFQCLNVSIPDCLSADAANTQTIKQSSNQAINKFVEAVYIPELNTSGGSPRATLCISCQVGCRMGCRFCVTGQQGFHGNLSAADILNQVFSIPEFRTLTNIVYMGMGEPMDNLDSVLRSTEVLTAPWGLGWSPHRITVSSVGIIPGLKRFLEESQCHLAISLHNPFAAERLAIMPMQKAYPIAEIIALLRQYDWSGQRRISFEYTMFRDLNDDSRHAAELVRLLKGLYCRVNLIRFHSGKVENSKLKIENYPGATANSQSPILNSQFSTVRQSSAEGKSQDLHYAETKNRLEEILNSQLPNYCTSTPQAIAAFQNYLNAHGITCTLRASRGEDIMAACGLLAGQKTKDV